MISNRSNVLIPGFVSETINIDGVNIHYKIGGDPNGQPVLLWHGFLSKKGRGQKAEGRRDLSLPQNA